jgi:hypothetical protein
MLNKSILALVVLVLTVSCAKQWSATDSMTAKLPKLKQKEFLAKLDSIAEIAPKYMYTKLKVSFKDEERKISFKTTLKAVNDSAITAIVSFARIPVFSALVDRSNLTVVNKKDKCYTIQKLEDLTSELGVSFQRSAVEELIYGHALGFSADKKYYMKNDPFSYTLSSHRKSNARKKNEIVYTYQLHENKKHLSSIKISVPMDSTDIEINYLSWQESQNYTLPKKVDINVKNPKLSVQISLEYTKLDVVTPEALFLTIPEKYEKCN